MDSYFSCGQYLCRINGNKEFISLIPNKWDRYAQEQSSSTPDITINVKEEEPECAPAGSDGWTIWKEETNQKFYYFQNGKVLFGLSQTEPYTVTVYVKKAVDSHLRIGIHYGLMLALHQECIGLHGVTLMCGNEIIILSAPSGTGKTTLAKLLEKYCDAVVINGDFALLTPTEDGVIFEPTPFCGSSGRALNHRFRVNRVVFLGQAKENRWCELDGREAMTRFMSNAFIPEWDSGMTQAVQGNILKCMDALKVNAYDFAPTQEAAEVFLEKILH